jgi:AraC-like DNA-binding protein
MMQIIDRLPCRTIAAEMTASAVTHRDMYDRWLAFLSECLFTYSLTDGTPKDPAFRINARSRQAGGFTLARFTTVGGKSRLIRQAHEIAADDRDGYVIYVSLGGQLELTQFDRTHLYDRNAPAMLSVGDSLVHRKLGDNDTLCFMLPREFVEQRVVRGDDLCVRPGASQSGARRLFTDTILAFARDADTMTDDEFAGATRIVGELALLAIGGTLEATSELRSVRTSSLARVKAFIRKELGNSELTLEDIARGCDFSVRYLHVLFRNEGCTAREYLTEVRLQRARHLLETAGSASTVIDISLACGFVNSSHFSTAFRRAFGLSPRDVLRGH